MKNISQALDDYWLHVITTTTEDGYFVRLTFRFMPYMEYWTVDVECDDLNFALYNIRLCTLPNLLIGYENQITFGLGVVTTNDLEAWQATCFEDGSCRVYLLTQEECQKIKNGEVDNIEEAFA
jgi:hypothetical protein